MADFTLVRPEAGHQLEINGEQLDGANVVLGFPADEAEIQRVGDDLVLSFEDEGTITVKDFYSSFTSENLPDFVIDGEAIPGEDFFAALGDETLMPAAGPAATAADNGARYHDYTNANMMDGIGRLGGLDVGWDGANQNNDSLEGFGDLFSGRINLMPSVMDFTHNLWEDDPTFWADGYALTGSIQGDGAHTFKWDSSNNAQYGKFIMNPDGTYRYELDNSLESVQKLGVGDYVEETFYFTYTDADGDQATGKITVRIYGTNDDPVIHVDQSVLTGEVVEAGVWGSRDPDNVDANENYAGAPSVSGQVVATDIDQNDVLTYTAKNENTGEEGSTIQGKYGTFTIDSDGNWTYTLDNDLANGLAQDEKYEETFKIMVEDGHGGYDEVDVTVTVVGTNDMPELYVTAGDDHVVTEDDTSNDRAKGEWSVYDPDSDGDYFDLTLTNDTTSNEDNGFTNGDLSGSGNVVASSTSIYGTLYLYDDGSYEYVLNHNSPDVQAIGDGEYKNDTFTIRVQDEHGSWVEKTITIQVNGVNDPPEIVEGGDKFTLTLTEEGVKVGGNQYEAGKDSDGHTFVVNDVDTSDQANLVATILDKDKNPVLGADGKPLELKVGESVTIEDEYGTLTISAEQRDDGSVEYKYNYHLDNDAADPLNADQTYKNQWTISVTDNQEGTTPAEHEINLELQGTNDRPELNISEGGSHSFTEDAGLNNDPDAGWIAEGKLEWGDADADGWDHKIIITSKDGNDAGTIGRFESKEDGLDVDGNAAILDTPYGKLTVNPDGTYTFELDNDSEAVQSLGVGDTSSYDLTFTVTIKDKWGATSDVEITIRINGVNDAPEIIGGGTSNEIGVKESGHLLDANGNNQNVSGKATDGGTFIVKDVDTNDTQTLQVFDENGNEITLKFTAPNTYSFEDEYGTFTIKVTSDGNGTSTYDYSYTLDPKKSDPLNDGDEVSNKYEIRVSDEAGESVSHEVTVNIEGTNDKPVVNTTDNLVLKDIGIYDDGNDGNTATTGASDDKNAGKSEHKVEAHGKVVGSDVDEDAELHYEVRFNGSTGNMNKPGMNDSTATEERDADGNLLSVTIETPWGTLVLNSLTGEYTFTLDTSKGGFADQLAQGQSQTLTFTARVVDEHGTWSDKTFTVRIDGTNDEPELFVTNNDLVVVEDGIQQDGGKAEYFDVDQGDTHTYSIIVTDELGNATEYKSTNVNGEIVVKGEYGTFILNVKTGEYKYVLNNNSDAVQGLKEQQTLEEQFTIRITDNNGGYADQDINVTIEGTNDIPIITSTGNVHNVSEAGVGEGNIPGNYRGNKDYEGNPTAEGQITATDKDAGDTENLQFCFVDENGNPLLNPDGSYVTQIETEYGTVTLDPNTGKYTYELDNDRQNVNELKANEQVQDKFQVAAVDPDDNVSNPADVVINITGTNDRPEITNATDGVIDGGSLKEDSGTYTTTGTVEATDVDLDVAGGEVLKYSFIDEDGNKTQILEGDYGYIVIDANTGEYTYHLYNDSRGVQKLGEGESAQDSFTVRVSDGYDAYDEAEIKITVEGTDDKPVINGNNVSLNEDGSNVEENVHPTTPGMIGGQIGWYDADANDEWLGYDITHPADKTTDLGNGIYRLEGKYGYLEFDTNTGEYKYYLDNANEDVDALNIGDKLGESFGISVTTGNKETGNESTTNGNINITINGTNDAPVIDFVDTLHVSDEYPEKYGYVTDHDVDDDTRTYHFIAEGPDGTEYLNQSSQGEYGSIYVDQNGKYTYVLDTQSQRYSDLTEPYKETFTITVTDPHGATATEEIEVWVYPEGWTGGEPGDGNHNWWHKPNPNPGDPNEIKDEYDVHVKEDTNIDPGTGIIIGGGAITDDSGNAIEGDYYFMVNGDKSQSIVGEYGTLYIRPDGSYEYVLNNDSILVQQLREGDTIEESFTVYKDGKDTGITINVTVEGTNDAPEITSTHNHSWVQDNDNLDGSGWSADGTVTSKDIDVNPDTGKSEAEDHTYWLIDENGDRVTTITGKYGTITIDPNTGEYTYTINPGQKDLTADDHYKESFKVIVDDGSGAENATDESSINIDIRGTNNEPELTVTHGEIWEDAAGGNIVTGSFVVEDDTAGWKITGTNTETGSSGTMIKGKYGYLFIKEDGSWEYVLNNESDAVQGLGEGESLTENFTITVTDKHGATDTKDFNITINGTNDEPELFVSDPMVIAEGDPNAVTGQATVYDKDVNDTHEFGLLDGSDKTTSITNDYGTFTIDPNTGAYRFQLDNESDVLKSLAQGQIMTLTFTIYVEDSSGALVAKDITVTITGTNDDPIVEGPAVSELKEDSGTTTATGQVMASDPDDGAVLTYSFADGSQRIETEYGTLVLNPKTGEYTYEMKNDSNAVQSLQDKEVYEDKFTVVVKDEHGGSVETEIIIKIEGTNDDPVITSEAPVFNITEDAGSVSGQIIATDVDTKDVLEFSVSDSENGTYGDSITGNYGTLTIDPETGKYTYELDDRAQALNKGDKVTETFWVKVDDGNGGYDWQQITVNITGQNDAPTIDDVVHNVPHELTAVAEGESFPSVSGEVHATDVDSNAQLTYGVAAEGATAGKATKYIGQYGTVTINPDGTYTYTLHEGAKALKEGELGKETFTVIVTDEHGATATAEITVDVTGINDAPEVQNPYVELNVTEQTDPSVNGNIGAVDPDGDDLTYTVKSESTGEQGAVSKGDGSIEIRGEYGTLTINEDGSYTYALHEGADALEEGELVDETFKITVDDGNGGSVDVEIKVNVTGTNNAPEVDMSSTVATVAAGALGTESVLNGQLEATDAEGDALTYSLQGGQDEGNGVTVLQGLYGTLTLNADGSYKYELNNDNDDVMRLGKDDEPLQDTFNFTVSDGKDGVNSTLTIDITSDNNVLSLESSGVLEGTDGDDRLFGSGFGDDQLYGGGGNDTLFAVGGDNNYLDGGANANQLYGGDGSDILVFSTENTVMNGGGGVDFLVGVNKDSLDTMFGMGDDNPISNIEVMVMESMSNMSLTSLDDFAAIGITVNGDQVQLDDSWTATGSTEHVPAGYVEYERAGEDGDSTTILVFQQSLQHGG